MLTELLVNGMWGDYLNMHKEDAGKSHQILAANPITARVAGKCKVAGGRGKDMHRKTRKKRAKLALLRCFICA